MLTVLILEVMRERCGGAAAVIDGWLAPAEPEKRRTYINQKNNHTYLPAVYRPWLYRGYTTTHPNAPAVSARVFSTCGDFW